MHSARSLARVAVGCEMPAVCRLSCRQRPACLQAFLGDQNPRVRRSGASCSFAAARLPPSRSFRNRMPSEYRAARRGPCGLREPASALKTRPRRSLGMRHKVQCLKPFRFLALCFVRRIAGQKASLDYDRPFRRSSTAAVCASCVLLWFPYKVHNESTVRVVLVLASASVELFSIRCRSLNLANVGDAFIISRIHWQLLFSSCAVCTILRSRRTWLRPTLPKVHTRIFV